MKLSDIISADSVACNVHAGSKKRALEYVSQMAANLQPDFDQVQVFDKLIARERLGSTGIGHGVAIPHSRIKDCDKPLGVFIQLSEGIDYDAIDDQPVDLLFALLVPEDSTEEHLEALSMLAEMFSNEQFRDSLHAATSNTRLYELLSEWEPVH